MRRRAYRREGVIKKKKKQEWSVMHMTEKKRRERERDQKLDLMTGLKEA